MISRGFKISLLCLFVAGGGAVAVVLHFENLRLRKRVDAETQRRQQVERLRQDVERARLLLAHAERTGAEANRTLQGDVLHWRGEVAKLEERARRRRTVQVMRAEAEVRAIDQNRDPEKGLTRLEYFHDAGRTTPASAFQTFGWAALQGEEARLVELITFTGEGRQEADAIVAALPDAERSRYSTPEKLAALFFADAFTTMQAAEVVGVSMTDSQHAIVRVRGLTPREQDIPMELGPGGWQIAVSESLAARLQGWSRGKSALPEGK